MQFMNDMYFGNSLRTWLTALGMVALSCFVLLAVKLFIIRRLGHLAKRTATDLDDMVVDLIGRTRIIFLVVVSIYAGSHYLSLADTLRDAVRIIAMLALLAQVGIWGNGLIAYMTGKYARERLAHDAASSTTLGALRFLGTVILWSVVLLLALENLGFDVTALLAGLGVTGIAVALAVQNILGDLLASLSIVLDKPFVVGDYIIVEQLEGTVERIGIKSTRVRSLSGEQIIFSNADLLRSRIRNNKRMQERRIVFRTSVTAQTKRETLERVPGMLKEIVSSQANARFDRAHFHSIGETGFVFETVYFVLQPDYAMFMNIQQAINFEIVKRFQKERITFAYPTRMVHVKG
jgi:small-conductance mechanosensitive channel